MATTRPLRFELSGRKIGLLLRRNFVKTSWDNILSQSGGLANTNTYRFSSKEQMPNSGMYYYGYRFYDPSIGKIQEE